MATLSEKIGAARTDRPDEWIMQELERDAKSLEAKIEELEDCLRNIVRVSDRKHNYWERAKELLQYPPTEEQDK